MGLDLWFRADVARILQATHEAMMSTAAAMGDQTPEDIGVRERAAGYRQGFGAALRAVATAFGLTEYSATDPPPSRYGRIPPAGFCGTAFTNERVTLYNERDAPYVEGG